MADLSEADYHSLKEIARLADQAHEFIDERFNKKMAKKFCESVEALLIKKPEFVEEQERKKLEAEQKKEQAVNIKTVYFSSLYYFIILVFSI